METMRECRFAIGANDNKNHKGIFHRWCIVVDYFDGKPMNTTKAIIEDVDNGHIRLVDPVQIKFCDNFFSYIHSAVHDIINQSPVGAARRKNLLRALENFFSNANF